MVPPVHDRGPYFRMETIMKQITNRDDIELSDILMSRLDLIRLLPKDKPGRLRLTWAVFPHDCRLLTVDEVIHRLSQVIFDISHESLWAGTTDKMYSPTEGVIE